MNGEELTMLELRAEAEATGGRLQDPADRAQLIKRLIDRRLKASAAAKEGLDRSPQYIAHRRRMEQELLAQLFMKSRAARDEGPTPHEVRMFILRNPHLFEGNQELTVDRISFGPATAVTKAEVDTVKTLADAEALLRRKGIKGERRKIDLDPATLPPEVAANLIKLPEGEAFHAIDGELGIFGAILEKKSVLVPIEKRVERATSILKRQHEQSTVEGAVSNLWRTAKIEYQKGFEPPRPK